MKKMVIIFILIFCAAVVFCGEQNQTFKVGFQADSDTYMGLLVKAGNLELGLKAKWSAIDTDDGNLPNGIITGAHLAYLLHGRNENSSLGAGIDFRTAFGEIGLSGSEYDEYVDIFFRLNYNYHLSENFMLSALFYPLTINTRESDLASDWTMYITVPSAALAATVFL